jgi:trigger factor
MEAEREDYRAIAERRVRLGLLLSEIGQTNGVEVTSQEMNQLVNQAAQQYRPADREKFVEYIRNEPMAAAQLRAPLFEDKVVDFLFAQAEITDRTVSREELQAEIEAEDGGHVHGPDCNHDHAPAPKAKKASGKKADTTEAPAPKKAKKGKAADAAPAAEEAVEAPAVKKAAPKKKAAEATAGSDEAPAPAKKSRGKSKTAE